MTPKVIKVTHQTTLVPTSEYPYAKFPFATFNPVQSRVIESYDQPGNYIVAAATSAGKTVCAEMFLAHEVREKKGKGMYLAPLKALAQEKIDDWTDEHHFHDLKVAICTGDYRITAARKKEIDNSNLIIMSSEMLNSRCRNFKSENNEFLSQIGTLVVDESHLLTVPGRGDHLESGIMKFTQINPEGRLVFLSATMPNVSEIGQWMSWLTRRNTVVLESNYRPCPLYVHYEKYYDVNFGYEENERSKIRTAIEIMRKHPQDKFLLFVHTKRTGDMLASRLKELGMQCEYHNADLTKDKRIKIEKRFKEDSSLRCLVATSTIAWGCYKHGSRLVGENGSLVEVQDLKEGNNLLCPTGQGFSHRKVVKIKDFESKEGYCVKLESGEEMVVSLDHVFWAATKRNSPDWVKVNEISKGDFLAVPKLDLWTEKPNFNRFWYLCGFGFGDGSITKCGNHSDGGTKTVLDLCLGERNEHADIVCRLFNEEFSTTYSMRDDVNGVPHLVTKKREIVDRFQLILPTGRKDGNDDLPKVIFGKPARIASFLSGWFDADGGMEDHSNGNKSVGLSCISKKAIETAKHLLLCFGIKSTSGKKKMKDGMINGRFQKAKREWSYKLRIFGVDNILKFKTLIGFLHPAKATSLEDYLEKTHPEKLSKDLIPARDLIKTHLESNKLIARDFSKITNCDLWNSINKQDCNRKTLLKLIGATNQRSGLNDLLESPVWWSRVKEIKKCDGGMFREIEVEDPHAYVGCGVISHNCNLPARRVIVLGVHRGMSDVATYDIAQMIGRAGRPQYDPQGDAYILLPGRSFQKHKERLESPQLIQSQISDAKCLAFHLTSEIHHNTVKSTDDIQEWYERSLAFHQDNTLNQEAVEQAVKRLTTCGAITEKNKNFDVTSIGTVASMFYYSPFDISDLARNFGKVFERRKEDSDYWVAMALGNIDSLKFTNASNADKEDMAKFKKGVEEIGCERVFCGSREFTDGALKAGCCYYNLLKGYNSIALGATMRGMQADAERLCEVLCAIDQMVGKWDQKEYFRRLYLRILYGVEEEMVDLCRLRGVGKIKAKRLWDANLRSLEDIAKNALGVIKALSCSKNVAEQICENAKELASNG